MQFSKKELRVCNGRDLGMIQALLLIGKAGSHSVTQVGCSGMFKAHCNLKLLGSNWVLLCCQRWSLTPGLKQSSYLSLLGCWDYRCIKDLNVKRKPIKPLEENLSSTIQDIGVGNKFMTKMPEAIATKARIDKWDLIKIKSFYTAK
ncbi:retrotransposable element ORF2 protein [Plecturocebus cupreus]